MSHHNELIFPEERIFGPDPRQADLAMYLYQRVAAFPLVSPHGHVSPRLFSDPQATFGNPSELFIQPDHYVFRMLYSQGIPLERLGISPSPRPLPQTGEGADSESLAPASSTGRGHTPSGAPEEGGEGEIPRRSRGMPCE